MKKFFKGWTILNEIGRGVTERIWAGKLREECTNVDGGMLEQEGKSRVWQPWTHMDRSYLM